MESESLQISQYYPTPEPLLVFVNISETQSLIIQKFTSSSNENPDSSSNLQNTIFYTILNHSLSLKVNIVSIFKLKMLIFKYFS